MRTLSIITALLFFLAISACSYTNTTDDTTISQSEKDSIKNLILGCFDEVWGEMDSTKIPFYHTEDFVILEHGEIWDNDRIRSWMKGRLENGSPAKRLNSMNYLTMEKYGDAIYATYNNYAKFMRGDSLVAEGEWLESAVAINTDEGWRLKHMHSTRVKR